MLEVFGAQPPPQKTAFEQKTKETNRTNDGAIKNKNFNSKAVLGSVNFLNYRHLVHKNEIKRKKTFH